MNAVRVRQASAIIHLVRQTPSNMMGSSFAFSCSVKDGGVTMALDAMIEEEFTCVQLFYNPLSTIFFFFLALVVTRQCAV